MPSEMEMSDREFAIAMSSIKNWADTFVEVDGKKFVTYDYQDEFWQNWRRNRVVVKARQLGMSWACALEALFLAMNHPDRVKILFVSRGYDQAVELLNHAKEVYYSLPDKIRLTNRILPDGTVPVLEKLACRIIEDRMVFANGSEIFSCPNNPETVRGYRAWKIYWDEAAKFPHEDDMQQAIIPCLSRGGTVVYNSTHQGTNSRFYDNAQKARENRSAFNFYYMEVPWTRCPDPIYHEQVEKVFIPEYGAESVFIQEEYCCVASDESVTMFPHSLLKEAQDLFFRTEGEKVKLPITPNGKYPVYVGVDVGRTKDLTVFTAYEQMEGYSRPIELWELRSRPFEEQKVRIAEAIKRLKPVRVRIDSKGVGMEMSEYLATLFGGGKDLPGTIEPMDFSPLVKDNLVYLTYTALQSKKVAMPDNRQLYAQMHNLRREFTENSRNVRFVQSESSMHDDYLWSFCMAVSQLQIGPQMGNIIIIGKERASVVGLDKTGSVQMRDLHWHDPKPIEPGEEITKYQYDVLKHGSMKVVGPNEIHERCDCGAFLDTIDKRKGQYVCNGVRDEKTGKFVRCHLGHTDSNKCTIDCTPIFVRNSQAEWRKKIGNRFAGI
jgi:phage FluMu gp28-like protein